MVDSVKLIFGITLGFWWVVMGFYVLVFIPDINIIGIPLVVVGSVLIVSCAILKG